MNNNQGEYYNPYGVNIGNSMSTPSYAGVQQPSQNKKNKKALIIGVAALVVVIVVAVIIYFVLQKKEKETVCTLNRSQDGMTVNATYSVISKGNYVKSVHSIETYSTSSSSAAELYKNYIESFYAQYNNIPYYDNTVTVSGTTVTSVTDINYDKIDIDQMIAIDSSVQMYVSDGKIDYKKLKGTYELAGASCK